MVEDMKIGEVREYDGKKYRCEEMISGCHGCAFYGLDFDCLNSENVLGCCITEDSHVIFVEVDDNE